MPLSFWLLTFLIPETPTGALDCGLGVQNLIMLLGRIKARFPLCLLALAVPSNVLELLLTPKIGDRRDGKAGTITSGTHFCILGPFIGSPWGYQEGWSLP